MVPPCQVGGKPPVILTLLENRLIEFLARTPVPAGQIVIEMKLFLQLQGLESCIGLSTSTPGTAVGTFDNWTLIHKLQEGAGKIKPTQNGERKIIVINPKNAT